MSSTPIPIIDAHQHVWDLDRIRLPWLVPGGPMSRSMVGDDYARAAERLGIVQTVYAEVNADPADHLLEAAYVLERIEDPADPMAAAVIGGRPADLGFERYIARFKDDSRIIGVRQILHIDSTPPGYCLSSSFVRGVQALGRYGKTFDLCFRPAELDDALRLVRACPETRFILDHCGYGDPFAFLKARPANIQPQHHVDAFRRDLDALGREPRVIGCKISALLSRMEGCAWSADDIAPVIECCYQAFGPWRVIFGGDWPVCTVGGTLRAWVEAVRAVTSHWPQRERSALFHENAKRIYRLS
jgi:L-fuconolactonase